MSKRDKEQSVPDRRVRCKPSKISTYGYFDIIPDTGNIILYSINLIPDTGIILIIVVN